MKLKAKSKGIIITIIMLIVISMSQVTRVVAEELKITPEQHKEFNIKLNEYKSNDAETRIKTLKALGILKGTEKGLELDRELTRAEGSVIYVRTFGLLDLVKYFKTTDKNYNTGFKDVPEWAKDNINYLHKLGVVNGTSKDTFGSSSYMSAEQFTTILLRGMGYDDTKGEFKWDKSLEKAVELGILTDKEKTDIEKDKRFTREEMSVIVYNLLFRQTKSGINMLANRNATLGKSNGVTQIFAVELTAEELGEINKILESEYVPFKDYQAFDNDKEKQNKLYDKMAQEAKNIIKLVDINIEGKQHKISSEVRVAKIQKNDLNMLQVLFDLGDSRSYLKFNYFIEDNFITIYTDDTAMNAISAKIAKDTYADNYKMKIESGDYALSTNMKGLDEDKLRIRIGSIGKHDDMDFELEYYTKILKFNISKTQY